MRKQRQPTARAWHLIKFRQKCRAVSVGHSNFDSATAYTFDGASWDGTLRIVVVKALNQCNATQRNVLYLHLRPTGAQRQNLIPFLPLRLPLSRTHCMGNSATQSISCTCELHHKCESQRGGKSKVPLRPCTSTCLRKCNLGKLPRCCIKWPCSLIKSETKTWKADEDNEMLCQLRTCPKGFDCQVALARLGIGQTSQLLKHKGNGAIMLDSDSNTPPFSLSLKRVNDSDSNANLGERSNPLSPRPCSLA